MGRYILDRFLASLLTIFVVITLTFFLMRLMPGGPFTSERITEKAREAMNAKYGLDKPVVEQYVIYLRNILHGDFGTSMIFKGKEVTGDIIFQFFPNSAKLGIVSVALSLAAGLGLGLLAGARQGRLADKAATLIATLGITIPSFVIGSVLLYTVGVRLRWLPTTGFTSWRHYIMPAAALSGIGLSFITRLTRTKYVEVKNSDFMRTARAKGLDKSTIIFKHGLRNSILPVITYMGPLIANVLTGSFVIERLFAVPGLGSDFVQSVSRRDYSVVMGVVIFYCIFIIACNFLVDILYVVVDPRIKLQNNA
ncbi:MAG: ABC transporter permease [Clostridiales bacterium]|nr:ABC transporter permease [Clostridiales bacterium]